MLEKSETVSIWKLLSRYKNNMAGFFALIQKNIVLVRLIAAGWFQIDT